MTQLLTVKQLCEQLNTSRRNLELLRRRGLPYLLLGSSPRFEFESVIEWMRQNTIAEEKMKHDHVFE